MRRGHIAIINTNPEMIRVLESLLEEEGHTVVSVHLLEMREGEVKIGPWLAKEDPAVLVIDVAPPYALNARFVTNEVLPLAAARGVVLTSTNPSEVRRYIPDQTIYQVLGKPYDLQQILHAIEAVTPEGFRPE